MMYDIVQILSSCPKMIYRD